MFDATSRLAEGRSAVDTVQEHVWACHLLGYQDSNLTLHSWPVRDWYGSEDGIDLHALDADCDALRAAAAAAEAALVRQDAQLASMWPRGTALVPKRRGSFCAVTARPRHP